MKILCTADWRSANPKPVIEIAKREKPDLILHGGNFQGENISDREAMEIMLGVGDLRHIAPFFGIAGELDTAKKMRELDIYIKGIDFFVSGKASILCLPSVVSPVAMDMLIPMFLEKVRTPFSIILAHGKPMNRFVCTEDSTGHIFNNLWTTDWTLAVVGGIPCSQIPSDNLVVPGSIERTLYENYLGFMPNKGVWIWEPETGPRFVEFTHAKMSAITAMEELYA
jgi:hypothetical protein